jgi:tripartite-type tricarboxylate transporter receptor subunit TctC
MKKVLAITLALCMIFALCAASAFADNYPSRTVNIIVPKGAGGPTDTVTRYFAQYAEKYDSNFKTTIENVTGANGLTGMAKGAAEKADGYTLTAFVVELALMQNIASFNASVTTEDFRPISICVCNPDLLCVKHGTYSDVYDFIEKVNKDTRIGNGGTYSVGDLTSRSVLAAWGKEYTGVPYTDGDASALQALIADNPEIDAMICAPSASLNSQVEAGNVDILCVLGATHVDNAPNAPLLSELENGYARDMSINAWAGIGVPKDTPDDVFNYLSELAVKVTTDPDFIADVKGTGSVPSAINGQDAIDFINAESAYYAEVLKDAK